jgi:hypothetical protein
MIGMIVLIRNHGSSDNHSHHSSRRLSSER